jgi:hypothetical protein
MCAYKEIDLRESPNDSTVSGGEGHGSRGETFHPHYRENPVSSLAERGVFIDTVSTSDYIVSNERMISE